MHTEDRRRFALMMVVFAVALLLFNSWQQRRLAAQREMQQTEAPARPAAGPEGTERPPAAPSSQPEIRGEEQPAPILVRTDELEVRLSSLGASVERVALVNFRKAADEPGPLVLLDLLAFGEEGPRRSMVIRGLRDLEFERWPFRLEGDSGGFDANGRRTVTFLARRRDVEVRKVFSFERGSFDLGLEVTVTNRSAERRTFDYELIGAAGIEMDEPPSRYARISARLAGRDSPGSGLETRNVAARGAARLKPEKRFLSKAFTEWAALRARYFAALLAPRDPAQAIAAFAEALDPAEAGERKQNLAVGLKSTPFELAPDESAVRGYFLRVGPQRLADLQAYAHQDGTSRGMAAAVDFTWSLFAAPSRWLSRFLVLLYRLVPNYGVCIFLLTLAVKLALHPIQRKGQVAMTKMQDLAPKLKALQEQYKDDPRKLQAAQLKLYKEAGFNPASGCLPLLIQFPVFIALYGAINGTFELRQAAFLWVGDLSRPDTVLSFGFWPHALNLLPILYAGFTAFQSFSQPLPADPQARQQQMMMRFMPLVFFLIIYSTPSAFVLYFACSAVIGYAESALIKRKIKALKERAAAEAPGRTPAAEPPVTDPAAYWRQEAERKLGKGRKK